MSTYDHLDLDDEKDLIDDEEIKKINRVLKVIKTHVAEVAKELDTEPTLAILTTFDMFTVMFLKRLIEVAKKNDTEDTKILLKACYHFMKEFMQRVTIEQARSFEAAYAAGNTDAVLDPALAEALQEKQSLEEQLEELQNTASGDKPRLQLGGGSDPAEQVKALIDANPDNIQYVPGILASIERAVKDGATPDDLLLRSNECDKVMAGAPGYEIVQGAAGTAPTIKMVVDAREEAKTAKAAKQAAEDALANERNDSVSGSLAFRLKNAGTSTVTMPTDAVYKRDIKSDLDTVVAIVKNAGRSVKPEAIKPKLNAIADQVGGDKLP